MFGSAAAALTIINGAYKQCYVADMVDDVVSYAGLSLLNVSLLHTARCIEQALATSRHMAKALGAQYIGAGRLCMLDANEWWLCVGMLNMFAGLHVRKMSGLNEYKHLIGAEMSDVCSFEREHTPIVLNASGAFTSAGEKDEQKKWGSHLAQRYNSFVGSAGTSRLAIMAEKKAHLVVRLIDECVGRDAMLQTVQHLLLATPNSANRPGLFCFLN